jgi:tetratricopeptide (TPR) repeat protein
MKSHLYSFSQIGLLCLLLLIILVSCKNVKMSAIQKGGVPSVRKGRKLDIKDPVLADLRNSDSLLKALTPLLLSSPASQNLENWFGVKDLWEPAYKSPDMILYCGRIIFKDFKKRQKISEAAAVLGAMGRIQHASGHYTVAIDLLQKARALAEEGDDPLIIGWILGALSNTFFHMKDAKTGKKYLAKALEIGEEQNDPGILCLGKMGLSDYYFLTGNQDTAMVILKEAIRMARAHKFYGVEAIGKLSYTNFLISIQDYDQVIAELTGQQIIMAVSISMPSCILNFNLYEAYISKKDYPNALIALDKGCVEAVLLDYGYGKAVCEKSWSEYYEEQGEYQAALRAFQKYYKVDKTHLGAVKQRELEILRTRQTINEKDWEIQRLQQAEIERRRTYLNWLYFGGLFFGLVGAFFTVVYFRSRIKMAYQEKVIAESKLKVLQSQMKPHFIYNAMTGIQNYVLRSEKIEAYNYLGKFAALLRIITRTSTETHIELGQEIELIKTYLELEKMRFREAFIYKLEVVDSLLNLKGEIPNMMIQPVVENAIIHGISGLEGQGELVVDLSPYQDGIKCVVTDNGRGRVAANEISQREVNQHLSIASVNSNERLEFLRSMGYKSARIEVEDHYAHGKATGTSVSIYLPFIAKKDFFL